MAILLSLFGLIKSYPLLLIVVGIAGLGTAAFHPQASAMTAAISKPEKRSTFQAIFIAAGNIGWALTPLIAVPVVEKFGFSVTPVFVFPGLLAFFLLLTVSKSSMGPKKVHAPLLPVLRKSWKELTKIMLVVAMRSLTYFGMVSYLSIYLKHRGVSTLVSSRLLFLMLFAGALGGLLGGFLADLFGRKSVLSVSLFLSGILFVLFFFTTGIISYILLTLAGSALLASFSITVVLAQSLISKNAAMASGLMLGFGTGIGGLGVGLLGILIDHAGVNFAIILLAVTPLIGAFLSLFVKKADSK